MVREREENEFHAQLCHHDDNTAPTDDPTWGFSVFVTSYSSEAQEKLPRALENWNRAQTLWIEHDIHEPAYHDKVTLIKRFKLDLVRGESLEGASDDRIRQDFRAWMAGLGYTARGDESPPHVTCKLHRLQNKLHMNRNENQES